MKNKKKKKKKDLSLHHRDVSEGRLLGTLCKLAYTDDSSQLLENRPVYASKILREECEELAVDLLVRYCKELKKRFSVLADIHGNLMTMYGAEEGVQGAYDFIGEKLMVKFGEMHLHRMFHW